MNHRKSAQSWKVLPLLALIGFPACASPAFPDDTLLGSPPTVPRVILAGARDDEPPDPPDADADVAPSTNPVPANQSAPASSAQGGPVAPPSSPVEVRVALSHAFYTKASPHRLQCKVDLIAKASTRLTRPPLNLVLLFDRSGSMAKDHKFEFAMQAAGMVVDNLSDRDVISLVAFSNRAMVLSPAGRAVNKEFLFYRLSQLQPQGHTNLSAGLMEAFAQIESHSVAGQRKQIIILTDGKANRGITNPKRLHDIMKGAHARGIGLSALGCGTQFDEKQLTDLATTGGGRYTCVQSPDQIPEAIAAEINGLLDVVAQNTRLEIRIPSGGRITRVYGHALAQPSLAYRLELGDVRDGDHSTFLLDIAPDRFEEDATVEVEVSWTLDNPETVTRETHTLHDQALFAKAAGVVSQTVNQGVMTYARVLDAMEEAEVAIQSLDVQRFRRARELFSQSYDKAHKLAIDTRDQQLLNQTFLLKHFMAELSAASSLLRSHPETRQSVEKTIDYRRYLLEHRGRAP